MERRIEATSVTLLGRLSDPKDGDAWVEFLERYRPKIIAACEQVGLQEQAVEDLVQRVLETMKGLLAEIKPEQLVGSFQQMLEGLVNRLVEESWGARARLLEGGAAVLEASQGLEELSDYASMREALEGLVRDLGDQYVWDRGLMERAVVAVRERVGEDWKIFECREFRKMEIRDIARELGTKVATVHLVVHRVKRMLIEEVQALRGKFQGGEDASAAEMERLMQPSVSGITKSPILGSCEEYGCQLNRVSVDELFERYQQIGFLYPAKLRQLASYWDEVRGTWAKMLEAGSELVRIVVAEGTSVDRSGWATVMSWRTTRETWQHQHLASIGHPMYSRAVLLGTAVDSIHHLERANGQNWFRPENRFPARVFGTLQRELGEERAWMATFDVLSFSCGEFDGAKGAKITPIVSTEQAEYEDFRRLVMGSRGGVYFDSEEFASDLQLEGLNGLYEQHGLYRYRRIFLAYDALSVPVAAVIAYRGPLGINFSFLENRCDLLCASEYEIDAGLLGGLLREARGIYRDFSPGVLPIVSPVWLRQRLLGLGGVWLRQYSQTTWLSASRVAYYRHMESIYVRLLKAFQRRGRLDRDLVRPPEEDFEGKGG